MPRSDDPALRLLEERLRMKQIRAALSGKMRKLLTNEERLALEAVLANAEEAIRRLESELRELARRNGGSAD